MTLDHLRIERGYWYLCSPYSLYKGGLEEAFIMACRIAGALTKAGIPVFCPIAHSHPIAIHGGVDPTDHDLWMRADTPMLEAAHGLIVAKMDGWDLSYGVAAEIEISGEMGKPIHFVEPEELF